jgi:hypothetical protein
MGLCPNISSEDNIIICISLRTLFTKRYAFELACVLDGLRRTASVLVPTENI